MWVYKILKCYLQQTLSTVAVSVTTVSQLERWRVFLRNLGSHQLLFWRLRRHTFYFDQGCVYSTGTRTVTANIPVREPVLLACKLHIFRCRNHRTSYDSQPFRSRANSLPGANRPIGPWPIRSLALSLLGLLAPWNFRSPERNGPGTFVPWNFRAQEYSLPGTFAPWNFRSLLVRDIICDTGYILMILTRY